MTPRPKYSATRAVVLAAATASAVSACSFLPSSEPSVPIPPGIPPDAGEPVPEIDVNAPGRTSDQLRPWAQAFNEELDIPQAALAAYGNAAETMRQTRPDCHLGWTTLAGIGHVETRHGRYQGAALDEAGVALPPIIGVTLDGSPGFADIPDTDGGVLDGDAEHDRAVGPMQFIPESWQKYGRDADGNGQADPNQIDDAAVAAARLLCETGGDLSEAENWQRAVMSYNASQQYLTDVRDAAAAYAVGTTAP